MYKLTLTLPERQAIDWVGHRYAHGNDLFHLLSQCRSDDDSIDWDEKQDIVYHVPEHVAWEINNIADQCGFQWDCFGVEFCEKLNSFCDKII